MESINRMVRSINMHIKRYNIGATNKVVCLHGFTGSSSTWEEVISYLPSSVEVLAIDLIGHGQTDKPVDSARYNVDEQIEDLHAIFQQLEWTHFTLVGYSMGGRLALAYTAKYPVDRLILESSSPGLADDGERQNRKLSDELLAERITKEGVISFVDFWGNIPLFQTQKKLSPEKQAIIRKERLAQSAVGLSNSLKGFSTGVQPSYWGMLSDITIPVLLVTGELDVKFCAIARRMQQELPNSHLEVIEDTGHAIHVEKPKIFATIIKKVILEEE
ncbi:2-succinyl-6-hydroxy-2,4-cyclohexadiene-1-carboxylate synthase [Psychrobacillus sp. NEAU-3TGS]|uniref:2-succinyl-6-hydroxy-2, 4-cyclohexadiene-1-carboxylate synthase n=1 Tax=Psychrobacillus sp. NEAU-3TGS TaxID=2995412 RepID=UPI0024982777|nr:2-succinyl-6-hydroxy-2,4-cyclohexadiene-1-carboxylate synthase [Psychrobacillus sp. NEAU-3TGS]MDI2586061.1 2-succinyl-6-hydroxy-2,4-cyclohexadiene-1-carboxylate synthase [Psychrobacillus sp. NEAU-3TGS]